MFLLPFCLFFILFNSGLFSRVNIPFRNTVRILRYFIYILLTIYIYIHTHTQHIYLFIYVFIYYIHNTYIAYEQTFM